MKKSTKFILITIPVIILLLIVIEIYLRFTVLYIKPIGFTFELLPDSIYIQTPLGKQLRPNTKIIIKNNHYSHRNITLSINSMGFRGPEIP